MIAYLSTQSNRVYRTYEEAREDAQTMLAVHEDEPNWDIAKKIASLRISSKPSKYITMVYLHI